MPVIVSNYLGGTPRALAKGLKWTVSKANANKDRIASLIVNYGTTTPIRAKRGARVLNKPDNVRHAADKLATFRLLTTDGRGQIPTVEWTEDREVALGWLKAGTSVVVRKLLRASEGRGIEIVKWEEWKAAGKPANALPQAPLYTRYFPKVKEVRVHVLCGKVLAYAEKKRKRGEEADNWVRSHSKGWIFATQGVQPLPAATEAALLAVRRLGLDFGAVDIAVSRDRVAVLEVNTGPGLEGSTLEAYTKAFKEVARNG